MCFSKETECFLDPHLCENFHLVPLLKCFASPEMSSPSSCEIVPVIQGPAKMPHFHEACLYSFFFLIFIYLFIIYGCVGSSFLCEGFL